MTGDSNSVDNSEEFFFPALPAAILLLIQQEFIGRDVLRRLPSLRAYAESKIIDLVKDRKGERIVLGQRDSSTDSTRSSEDSKSNFILPLSPSELLTWQYMHYSRGIKRSELLPDVAKYYKNDSWTRNIFRSRILSTLIEFETIMNTANRSTSEDTVDEQVKPTTYTSQFEMDDVAYYSKLYAAIKRSSIKPSIYEEMDLYWIAHP